MIYSFYNNESREALEDHIRLALEKAEGVESSRLARIEPLDPKRFAQALRVSIIAHDIGKTFYQVEYKGRMNFRGHEVISAYVVDRALVEVMKEEESWREWRLPLVFSVLYHHHAMGFEGWDRNYLKYKRRAFSSGRWLLGELSSLISRVSPPELGDMIRMVTREIRKLGEISTIEDFVREVNISVQDTRKRIWENFTYGGDAVMRKRSLALLSGLITADYLASNESRGGGTGFLRVLKEFHTLYMIPLSP